MRQPALNHHDADSISMDLADVLNDGTKTPETPNLSEICPSDCFWGFQSRGLKFGKICQNLSENYHFSNFDEFLTNFSPPDWNPQKQSLGQISDKFRVLGVFEGCKGEKGSQH